MTNRRTTRLLRRYLNGTASLEEVARVEKWWAAFPEGEALPGDIDLDRTKATLYQRIRFVLDGGAPVIPLHRRAAFRVGAVAALLILVIGGYWLRSGTTGKPSSITSVAVTHDVAAPVKNRATITLADGKTIALDSAANGLVARQGSTRIQKTAAGRLEYLSADNAAAVQYNTVFVPRGSRIVDLTLADGTRIWLNSASSLRYPVAFTGSDRRVEITGEAYFEVAADPGHPFFVEHAGTEVEVLGTDFNCNAYEDEATLDVSLVSGAVRVRDGGQERLLKPGQQAQVSRDAIRVANDVDMEAVLAWKDGRFQFGDAADIREVMRQISRWYDVDIEYEGTPMGHIGGMIGRDANMSKVLRLLELTGAVRFRIDGKKVVVMPGE
jgi:ferric-dicitrate binding protein FerR (iron transport regulator)